jgi:S-DNA-T family DNA segregation ATPase FtsK/SpoIIIE
MGQVANDQVLGTSSYRNGVRASMFSRKDLGIGYLAGEGDDPSIVRTYYVDAVGAERVVARAKAARENDGRLTGHAVGDAPKVSTATLLDDLAAALGTEKSAWSETVIERLADLRPDTYGEWTVEAFAAAIKPYGLTTRQINRTVDGERINRRGITRAAVDKAIAARADRRQHDDG